MREEDTKVLFIIQKIDDLIDDAEGEPLQFTGNNYFIEKAVFLPDIEELKV